MPDTWKTVRVFISSTFRDMHAERDHLVTVVFPELRERVEKLGLEFFDVDLRWGVPEKNADGEKANSWEYCRQWIDRVEPFFVCILGQRYGWVPAAKDFKSIEDKRRQESEPRSITDLEVRHAVLDDRKKRRSYFYLRQTAVPAIATEYVDPPPLSGKLEQLKNEVRSCGRPVQDYPCEWTGSGFTGMDEFGRSVLEDLWSGVLRDERYVSKDVWRQVLGADPDADPRYTDESEPVPRELWEKLVSLAKPEPKEPLEAEREQMATFATARLRWFQGRTSELEELMAFIRDNDESAPRLAVVAAEPGQGKSALLAKLSTLIADSSIFLITHFVGATERSSSAHALVERLLGELDRIGIVWSTDHQEKGQEPNRDFNSLCLRLAERLRDYAGERGIVILVDALNQLSDGHDLQWLPTRLGPSVRVIVSCVEDSTAKASSPEQIVLHALATRQPAPLRIPLGPLTEGDVRTIVIAYLKEYCHELDREHLDALGAVTQARNPLYLLVMLNELRTLGGDDLNRIVPARIVAMPQDYPDTVSLFRWSLQRLEVFGPDAARWWCLYLAHGRVGMASHELADLLIRKLGEGAAATGLRIERGLRRYLQRRSGQIDFFHSQLRQAVFEQYGQQTLTANADIAAYFRDLADPEKNQSWKGNGARPFRELPFHLVHARIWPELVSTLENIFFLEAKVAQGMVFELAKNFTDAVEHLSSDQPERRILRLLEEALRRDIHFISRHQDDYPQGVFQCLWNLCWWYDCPEVGRHYETATAPRGGGGHELSALLEKWHTQKEQSTPGFYWLRSHRPPAIHLGTGLVLHWYGGGVSYSPDGRRFVSTSGDALRLWDAESGMELWRRPEGDVTSLAFSPDGKRIVIGSSDATVRVWDAESGAEVAVLHGHERNVKCVAYSPDGQHVAIGFSNSIGDLSLYGKGVKTNAWLWDVSSGSELVMLPEHEGWVTSLAFSPDGRRIVSASDDETVRVWDADSGSELAAWPKGEVKCVAYSSDGQRIVGGIWDNTVRVWDASTGSELAVLSGHDQPVISVAYSPDGLHIVSGSLDKTVRVWDASSGEELAVLHGHEGGVSSVGFSPDGQRVVSGSGATVWDTKSEAKFAALRGDPETVNSLGYSPDGRRIVTGGGEVFGRDNAVRVWDVESGQEIVVMLGHEWDVRSAGYSPDGRRIVSGSWDNTVREWNADSGEALSVLRGHELYVNSVRYSPDGRRIVSGSADDTVRVWDAEHGAELAVLSAHEGGVECVGYSPDGRQIVSGGFNDNTVRVWDADSGRSLAVLRGHEGSVQCVGYSPDCRRIISGSSDKTVRLWDATTGLALATLRGHEASVEYVAYSPDGKRIVSGTWSETVRVWDAKTSECLEVIHGGGDVVAIAGSLKQFPFRALRRSQETVIEIAAMGQAVCWFPEVLNQITTHSAGRTWAGSVANHIYIVSLGPEHPRTGLASFSNRSVCSYSACSRSGYGSSPPSRVGKAASDIP